MSQTAYRYRATPSHLLSYLNFLLYRSRRVLFNLGSRRFGGQGDANRIDTFVLPEVKFHAFTLIAVKDMFLLMFDVSCWYSREEDRCIAQENKW